MICHCRRELLLHVCLCPYIMCVELCWQSHIYPYTPEAWEEIKKIIHLLDHVKIRSKDLESNIKNQVFKPHNLESAKWSGSLSAGSKHGQLLKAIGHKSDAAVCSSPLNLPMIANVLMRCAKSHCCTRFCRNRQEQKISTHDCCFFDSYGKLF